MSTLKPCPFCGSENIQRAENGYGAFWTICDECGACTGEAGVRSQEEADARWNTRAVGALQEAARALVEKLDEAMPFIDRMCARQQNRGQPYSGPQLGDELEALRAALVGPASGGSCDTALKTSGDVEALEKVWVLGSGEYEDWMIHGIFDSLAAATDGAKAMYSDEYAVDWEESEQFYGDTYFLRGHIPRSIPGKCFEGPKDFEITAYELRRHKAAERRTPDARA